MANIKSIENNKNITMQSADSLSAKMAECFVTINGERYNFFNMIDFEAKLEKTKSTIPILGKMAGGNRSTGAEGTFSGTLHYNQSFMRKMMLEYLHTGKDTYFEIQVTNEDPTTSVGRQTVVFTGCNLDSLIMAKFDADGEYLDEEFEGTFEDCNMSEMFEELVGIRR